MGKLFPGPSYNCVTWACRQVTHVCTLTLCFFLFELVELFILRRVVTRMTKEQGTTDLVRSAILRIFLAKILEYSANFALALFDAL
jgi:hypothetical protein